MLKYLFGIGEDDSRPLIDEPTIDYNETIHSNIRYPEKPNKSILKDSTVDNIPVLDYSDSELDYDDDLINDINLVKETTQTSDFDRQHVAHEYPGNYPKSRDGTRDWEKKYENDVQEKYDFDRVKLERYTSAESEPNYESTIDRKLNKLRIEVDNELNSYRNKSTINSDTPSQLHELNLQLKKRTQYLNKLSQLITVYNQEQNQTMIPPDIMNKYDSLKTDYLQELKRTQTLYLAYYRLLEKHLQYRKSTPKKVSKEATKSVIPIREKLKLIQSKTSEASIKNLVGNVLSDVNKWEVERDELLKEKEQLQKELSQLKLEKEKTTPV